MKFTFFFFLSFDYEVYVVCFTHVYGASSGKAKERFSMVTIAEKLKISALFSNTCVGRTVKSLQ